MINDLILCFVLPFEHFYTVSIYVTLKNKLQYNNGRTTLHIASNSLGFASYGTFYTLVILLSNFAPRYRLRNRGNIPICCFTAQARSGAWVISLISSFCPEHLKTCHVTSNNNHTPLQLDTVGLCVHVCVCVVCLCSHMYV